MLIVFFGILVVIVKYAGTIRNFTYQYLGSKKSVAGAQTSLEKEINNDAQGYTESIKDQVMDMKVSDVVQSLSGVNKIEKDIEGIKKYLQEQLQNSLKLKVKS